MQNVLLYVYTSLPFIVVLLLALLAVTGVGIGIVWPRLLVYAYLAVFFFMNSTSYGSLAASSPGIYSRGSGVLFFPLLLWCMFGAWCCARVSAGFSAFRAPLCNLRAWFLAWSLLLGAHVAVAMFSHVTLAEALAPSGFSNIIWMAPLVSMLMLSYRTPAHGIELSRFILLAGCARASFGLARWAVLGGDPNNVYANMNAIKIKLTFFDINDSLLCTVAFAIAAVNLFQTAKIRRASFWVALDWATLCMTAACIVLSYRRSAWLGFVLASLIVMMRFPLRRRLRLLALGMPLMGAGLLLAAWRRLGQTKGAGSGLSSLFYDMESRRFGAQSERVLELKFALADFFAHPFTGIGTWGRYAGYQHISWQAGEEGGRFLHSGVLHIALKTGLPGLILLGGTIWAFSLGARHALRTVSPEMLGLATAGAAGLAFMLPDLLIGTPFPQVRTTQMLALCLALPYVALAVCGARPALQAAAPARKRGHVRLVPTCTAMQATAQRAVATAPAAPAAPATAPYSATQAAPPTTPVRG
jgi:hypothetical protein